MTDSKTLNSGRKAVELKVLRSLIASGALGPCGACSLCNLVMLFLKKVFFHLSFGSSSFFKKISLSNSLALVTPAGAPSSCTHAVQVSPVPALYVQSDQIGPLFCCIKARRGAKIKSLRWHGHFGGDPKSSGRRVRTNFFINIRAFRGGRRRRGEGGNFSSAFVASW